jgi:hypothetical protein
VVINTALQAIRAPDDPAAVSALLGRSVAD